MVAYENESLPDDEELDGLSDREEDVQLAIVLVAKSKLYIKMIGLLVKSTITTSHSKKIPCKDESKNYISVEDIDGVEVQLL